METEAPGVAIGRRVRALRDAGMFTRHELAERSGLSEQGIVKLESGGSARPRRKTIEKVARGLGVPVEALLEETSPKLPLGDVVSEQRLAEAQAEQEHLNERLNAGKITPAFYARRVADLWASVIDMADRGTAERDAHKEAG